MEFYSQNTDFLLNGMLLDELNSTDGTSKKFPCSVTKNIPFISFPDLTPEENATIFRLSQEVLLKSIFDNHYNEVSITYRIDVPPEDKKTEKNNSESKNNQDFFSVAYGNEYSVPFLDDEKIPIILASTDNLVIVNLHNHTNDSDFSLRDITIFSQYDNLRLMQIVNTKGEVSFLYKPEKIDLKKVIAAKIVELVPDYKERLKSGQFLTDTLSSEEKSKIVKASIQAFIDKGVDYSKYIDKSKITEVHFVGKYKLHNEEKEKKDERLQQGKGNI